MVDRIDLGIGEPPATQLTGDEFPGAPAAPDPDVFPGETVDPAAGIVVDPLVVRGVLETMGTLLAQVPGLVDPDVPDHWQFTPAELDALTPPITRIVQARPQLAAAAARGDELTVAIGLAMFGVRNYLAGAQAQQARARAAAHDDDPGALVAALEEDRPHG